MPYSVGQNVVYTSLSGRRVAATILLRKIDFPEGYINSDNAKGGFDYLISIDGKDNTFCNEEDLE